MDQRLLPYVSQNASENCSLNDARKLEKQLGVLGFVATNLAADGLGIDVVSPAPPDVLTALGMQATDELNYVIQVSGQADPAAWFTAATEVQHMAPLNAEAVLQVASDLYGAAGGAYNAAYSGLARLPGVDALVKTALTIA
jgi:hypothetical protein